MNKKISLVGLALLLGVSLSGCGSLENGMGIRVFPPAPADKEVNNAAFLVDRGPYADDCWMFGWGCRPPSVNSNIRVGGPYYNPAPVVYVADGKRFDTFRDCKISHPAASCRHIVTKP